MQAKAFTGKEIVMDPHWRAAPSLWTDDSMGRAYRKKIDTLNRGDVRSWEAFVASSDLGAYIVFFDSDPPWERSVVSDEIGDSYKGEMLCHELGHLLTQVSGKNMGRDEAIYYSEQTAILSGSMIKAAIGNSYVSEQEFPLIKEFQPLNVQEAMVYDSFSVYTPSPLAKYYNTSAGKADGRNRFISRSGIIRFDRIAAETCDAAPHLGMHLAAMEIFGGITRQLTTNLDFAERVVALLPAKKRIIRAIRNNEPQTRASLIMSEWKQSVNDVLGKKNCNINNMYFGDQVSFTNVKEANGYFLTLAAEFYTACKIIPGDYLLSVIHDGLNAIFHDTTNTPQITSRVTASSVDKNGDSQDSQMGAPRLVMAARVPVRRSEQLKQASKNWLGSVFKF